MVVDSALEEKKALTVLAEEPPRFACPTRLRGALRVRTSSAGGGAPKDCVLPPGRARRRARGGAMQIRLGEQLVAHAYARARGRSLPVVASAVSSARRALQVRLWEHQVAMAFVERAALIFPRSDGAFALHLLEPLHNSCFGFFHHEMSCPRVVCSIETSAAEFIESFFCFLHRADVCWGWLERKTRNAPLDE